MKKGFTLLEVLLSVLILGMVTAVFVPIFGTGVDRSTAIKYRTSGIYNSQAAIDREIDTINNSDGVDIINIKIGEFEKQIQGTVIESEINEVIVKTFVPNIEQEDD